MQFVFRLTLTYKTTLPPFDFSSNISDDDMAISLYHMITDTCCLLSPEFGGGSWLFPPLAEEVSADPYTMILSLFYIQDCCWCSLGWFIHGFIMHWSQKTDLDINSNSPLSSTTGNNSEGDKGRQSNFCSSESMRNVALLFEGANILSVSYATSTPPMPLLQQSSPYPEWHTSRLIPA